PSKHATAPINTVPISHYLPLPQTDPKYPRPHIFPNPGAVGVLGTRFTILCKGGHGATFLLHREGSSAPIQRQAPRGHTALFSIPHVSWVDSGTYSCSYRPRGKMFVSSYPSTFLELEVVEEEEEEEESSLSGSTFFPAHPDIASSLGLPSTRRTQA
uniref:Ig-like domain-containing protein n=1 Tax=Dromaius novaehollandiae TaxID=8790 RepID=A0A8C4P2A6_DRONO